MGDKYIAVGRGPGTNASTYEGIEGLRIKGRGGEVSM